MTRPPDPNQDEARRRLSGAFGTLESARLQLTREDLPAGIACFLAHLAAEKSLKALLVALNRPFRKIHDLVELRRLIDSTGLHFEVAEVDLRRLNPWAIDGRYAEDVAEASHARAEELVGLAAEVFSAAEGAIDEAAEHAGLAEQLLIDQEEDE